MSDWRLPKQIFHDELTVRKRSTEGQIKRFKDTIHNSNAAIMERPERRSAGTGMLGGQPATTTPASSRPLGP